MVAAVDKGDAKFKPDIVHMQYRATRRLDGSTDAACAFCPLYKWWERAGGRRGPRGQVGGSLFRMRLRQIRLYVNVYRTK